MEQEPAIPQMLQFLQTLHIHSRKEGLMNPKKKVSCMETVGGLKYVEDGYVVHGTFLLKLLMQLRSYLNFFHKS